MLQFLQNCKALHWLYQGGAVPGLGEAPVLLAEGWCARKWAPNGTEMLRRRGSKAGFKGDPGTMDRARSPGSAPAGRVGMLGSKGYSLSCLAGSGRAFICILIIDSDLQLPWEPTNTTNKEERETRDKYIAGVKTC